MILIRTSPLACAFGELGERISKNELIKDKTWVQCFVFINKIKSLARITILLKTKPVQTT